jgi:hypothetical protein
MVSSSVIFRKLCSFPNSFLIFFSLEEMYLEVCVSCFFHFVDDDDDDDDDTDTDTDDDDDGVDEDDVDDDTCKRCLACPPECLRR